MANAIQVENVYKQYDTIGTMRIRTILQDAVRAARATSSLKKNTNPDARYVLNNISFNLAAGKSLGLIGHNGSGKTTILRLLAGVSLPTKGRVRVVGKVAPLLALGAGFHPELSGYDNLFLNCTLMGLNQKQSVQRIDQIIEFADIGEYISTPIKRYSSGMLARLGFAAAIHMEPEVILLDEVLSVGDYNFSAKASRAIEEFSGKGTLVFVSHDLSAVQRLCERALWIDHGRVRADGTSSDVVAEYLNVQGTKLEGGENFVGEIFTDSYGIETHKIVRDPRVDVIAISVHNGKGERKSHFELGDDILIRCQIRLTEPVADLRATIGLTDVVTETFITACDSQRLGTIGNEPGDIILESYFPAMNLRPRGIGIRVRLSDTAAPKPLATWNDRTPRIFAIGPQRDPEHHYYEPQNDMVFTPNVVMRRLSVQDVDPIARS